MLASCTKEDLDGTSVVKDSPIAKTSFDNWLDAQFLQPYNIELKYRLNDYETNFTYTQVPADINNSVKLAHIILHTWLQAYDEVAGREFTRKLAPKVLQFVGSVAWETDNSAIMGQAEDGMKVTLFGVNQLKINRTFLNDNYFQSMHHEFTHILTQNKDYDTDFQLISEGQYEPADWRSSGRTETYALRKGFLSAYAMSEYNEDFAETMAFYLIYTPAEWTAKMAIADSYDEKGNANNGSAIIQKKLQMVRSYMQSSWNVDIDQLRTVVQRRMDEIIAGTVDLEAL
jgi:substrate import-associated zinc metallohydrolase lipoprotein